MKKVILIVICVLILAFIVNLFIKGNQSQSMKEMNTYDGEKLGQCSEKPNCVSSFNDTESDNYITPLNLDKLSLDLRELDLKGFNVIRKEENYIYMTHKSKLFGFVDDVEILVDSKNKLIHFRSASRVGYSDLGANRKRIKMLKEKLR